MSKIEYDVESIATDRYGVAAVLGGDGDLWVNLTARMFRASEGVILSNSMYLHPDEKFLQGDWCFRLQANLSDKGFVFEGLPVDDLIAVYKRGEDGQSLFLVTVMTTTYSSMVDSYAIKMYGLPNETDEIFAGLEIVAKA